MISYSRERRWALEEPVLRVASRMPDILKPQILNEPSNKMHRLEALNRLFQVRKCQMWHHSLQREGQNKLKLVNIHTLKRKLKMSSRAVCKRTRLCRIIGRPFLELWVFCKGHKGHQLKAQNNSRSKWES